MSFPLSTLLPKSELQTDVFLQNNPSYDGRGIIVAIFDTGVDPGAEGMEVTTDRKVKVIDIVDATGSGDVDISATRDADSDGVIEGLSGRKLRVSSKWSNSSSNYRVGIKRAYELFPDPLVNRLKEERKKVFNITQASTITSVKKKVETATDDKDDLQGLVEQLNQLQSSYEDPGPIFDIVAWNDGENWRCVVYPDDQTSDIINLDQYKPLTDYRKEKQYSTFTGADKMNYSVNFYNDGKVLSIVTTAGSHGTHVAGIVAANYPTKPELNGQAPGAQIVSVKIGNNYLGSMETNLGLCRGIIAAKLNNCHLINTSYGEATSLPDEGRFAKQLRELINEHNVVFVSSAGNSGPALSTFGTPGEISDVIGVGAYVSPEMMNVQYSLRDKLPETQYTWSSRGPSLDGHTISISGAGCAITCVPEYTLQNSQRMNGTSMSSPSVCGGIACLMSGLQQTNQTWNPAYIRRAIENSARSIPNVEKVAQGCGLLQVKDAFDYMTKHPYNARENLRYQVTLPDKRNARGLYLREYIETSKPSDHSVSVKTIFAEAANNKDKIDYHKKIVLQATQDWIQTPQFFMSLNETNQFSVRVNPSTLSSGLHYGEVQAYEAGLESAGPLFRLPVTVAKPIALPSNKTVCDFGAIKFTPGKISRNFLVVPQGAQFAEITITATAIDTKRTFLLHCLQLRPKTAFSVHEYKKYMFLAQDEKQVHYIKCIPGGNLEICFAQFWSSLGVSEITASVEFHGVSATPDHLNLTSGDITSRLSLDATLKAEELKIKATLDTLTQHLRPKSADFTSYDDERNKLITGEAVYQLVLTYQFKLEEACQIITRIPSISSILYENILESQLIMVFDGNKKLLKVSDAWPKKFKAPKGDITVRVQFRHDKLSLLESLQNTILDVDRTLAKEIAVTVYGNVTNAIEKSGTKIEKFTLPHGRSTALYVVVPEDKDLPKEAKAGDLLSGKIQLFEKSNHASVPLTYSIPARVEKKEDKSKETKELEKLDTRTPQEKFQEYLIAQQVSYLSKLTKKPEEFDPLMENLLKQCPEDLSVLKLQLQYLDESKNRIEKKDDICAIADKIIGLIDATQLAIHFGTIPKNKETTKEDWPFIFKNKEMEKQKGFLVDALYKKANILADTAQSEQDDELLKQTVKELGKWVDTASGDIKYLDVEVTILLKQKKYAKVLELVRKALSEGKASDTAAEKKLFDKVKKVVQELGWNHWSEYFARTELINYPNNYPLF